MITLSSGRQIGPGQPVFIIAEIGSNWFSLDDCLASIRAAKACGADAVKFQYFTHLELYGIEERPVATFNYKLPFSWLEKLKAQAESSGIEFMCSAFSTEGYKTVDPYVNLHKVASAECTHKRILETVKALNKPVIISTGGHGDQDIAQTVSLWQDGTAVATQLGLLACVSNYPAREVDLGRIADLQNRLGTIVGYSDHTLDVRIIARQAARVGASLIEKHVAFVQGDTPDSPHSLDEHHFRDYVAHIRSCWGRAEPVSQPLYEERDMVLRHNRRLIATKDISQGELLLEERNFGIYRSLQEETRAYSPWMVDEIHGKPALRDIKKGCGIGPGDA